ncbi:MAG TPA: cupredoxin domain-containing protein [Methylomirabilota bacterium]|nr:cupredoxin domain-containing protein [Methylomirabilota bacterium]
MRSIRLLAAGLTLVAVAACATNTPGWTYAPAPSATPVPSVDASGSAGPSGSGAAPSGSAAPSASSTPSETASAAPSVSAAASGAASAPPSASAPTAVVEVAAQNIAFTPTELSVAPDVAFQINFANNDPGVPHNVAIKDAAGTVIFTGDVFNGPETRPYDVAPLAAGTYQFFCSVHPNMTGTLTAQ